MQMAMSFIKNNNLCYHENRNKNKDHSYLQTAKVFGKVKIKKNETLESHGKTYQSRNVHTNTL